MRIAFNAKLGNKPNRQHIGLAKGVVRTPTHSSNDGRHDISVSGPGWMPMIAVHLTLLEALSLEMVGSDGVAATGRKAPWYS